MIVHLIVGMLALQTPAAAARTTSSPTATLIALYDTAHDADTKEEIIRQLGERDGAKAAQKLEAIAKGDADADLRDAAIREIANRR